MNNPALEDAEEPKKDFLQKRQTYENLPPGPEKAALLDEIKVLLIFSITADIS